MQLDLFESIFIGYNKGVQALLELDPEKALDIFRQWQQRFRGKRDLSLEYELIEFISRKEVKEALETHPQMALKLWEQDMEPIYKSSGTDENLVGLFRKRYFQRVSDTILALAERQSHSVTLDMLMCLLRARLFPHVVRLGHAILENCTARGRALGYIGDALLEKGESEKAALIYLRALLEGPFDVDLEELRSEVVRHLVTKPEEVLEEFFDEDIFLEKGEPSSWGAAAGLLTGVFPIPKISDTEGLKEIYDRMSGYSLPGRERLADGILFAYGIILSQHGMETLSRLGINLVHIRAKMQCLHEQLFKLYMKHCMKSKIKLKGPTTED